MLLKMFECEGIELIGGSCTVFLIVAYDQASANESKYFINNTKMVVWVDPVAYSGVFALKADQKYWDNFIDFVCPKK